MILPWFMYPKTQINADWNAVSGSAQILNKPAIPAAQVQSDWNAASGLGAILNKPTIPTVKRLETYIGTTDASGLFTVTYPAAFAVIPNVQPEPPSVANYTWIKVSSTTTGFSLRLIQRASLTVLGLELLAATFTNVAGASAKALVVES